MSSASSHSPPPPSLPPRRVGRLFAYAAGGLAGMGATSVVQPMDMIKVRMQLAGEGTRAGTRGPVTAAVQFVRQEGVLALYTGLSAGLLRQATYCTSRMGFFNLYKEWIENEHDRSTRTLPFWKRLLAGCAAGATGAFIANPTEVALIRMMSDGRLPVEQQRGYRNALHALWRIVRDEGVAVLWRGSYPTVIRAAVLNATQLGVYDQAKQMIKQKAKMRDGIALHFSASIFSAFACTISSMPFDMAKTRIQTMKPGTDGRMPYSGMTDVVIRCARKEGFFSLWKGFVPYFMRVGPHTVITFLLLEQINNIYFKYKQVPK